MNKIDIFNKLQELNLDKSKIIVISGASLVVQDVIAETSDIDLSCSKSYYDKIDWPTKVGAYGLNIKYYDCFEIGYNLYHSKEIIKINGYRFMNLKRCLIIKEELHRNKDEDTINKIKKRMEEQILKDKELYPSNEILEKNIKDYSLYSKFMDSIESINLIIEWRYYNDGKVWLGKLLYKKKNMGWLSIWNTGFKVSIFFTEKTIDGFNNLSINDKIKSSLDINNHMGKLIPLIVLINNENVLNDIITILKYKISIK